MKCPAKYGRIYDHKGVMSTTNWHLPRALPTTEQQRHLSSASMEIRTSLVAQTVKRLFTMWGTRVQSLGQEDPLEEGNGNPLQYYCLKNPMDRGAW